MQVISLSLDLSKIDKSRIVNHANGSKYYGITVIVNDQPNQYGKDCSVSTEQTKQEREAKVPKSFIGQGKVVFRSNPQNDFTPPPVQNYPMYPAMPQNDDLQF